MQVHEEEEDKYISFSEEAKFVLSLIYTIDTNK